jgi:bacillolysin
MNFQSLLQSLAAIKLRFSACVLILFCFLFLNKGLYAQQAMPGIETIWKDEVLNVPKYIKFKDGYKFPMAEFAKTASLLFGMNPDDRLEEYQKESDNLGYTHIRYHQFYKNTPVNGAMIISHNLDENIRSVNGEYYPIKGVNTTPSISSEEALKKALSTIHAVKYRWEIEGEEKLIKKITNYANATWYPTANLVICAVNGNPKTGNFRLAYKFDIYAIEPLSRENIFIDAQTGEVISRENLIQTADAQATAKTKYSGTQTITVDSISKTSYKLRQTAPAGGMQTYNMGTGTTYSSAVNFTNKTKTWNNVNSAHDEVATDAHWGAEMTYNYYKNIHGRNSFDNAGGTIYSYVHYYTSYNNAFWDGAEMTYGDGDGTSYKPFTSLDVCGHEISHGVTQHSAALAYQNESGAMNESFSDIFGTCVEFYAKDTLADWLIGKDFTVSGKGFRDMAGPKNFKQPNTLNGTYYVSTSGTPSSSNDYNGVHTNSGILNYWFYLVAHGGSGTNDNSKSYSVTGISLQKAEKIAYRMLSVYLSSTSTFADARHYSLIATTDLYGGCSNEIKQVTNAWYAVGVGSAFNSAVTPLSGTYTIGGTSPDYTTFTKAAAALSAKGICGNVVFNVRSGSYKEQVRIGGIAGTSSSSTITFQSQVGDSSKVILTYPSSSSSTKDYTLNLDSATYITFKEITIQRTGSASSTYAQVIYLSGNASFNNFIHNNIRGQYAVSTALIGTNSLVNTDASAITYTSFQGNAMHAGLNGLYLYGSTSSYIQGGNTVDGNTIDSFGLCGVYFGYQVQSVITNNLVQSNSFSSSAYASYGIRIETCDGGFDVSKNKVYMSGTAVRCRGIVVYSSANYTGYTSRLTNNFVRVSSGSSNSTGLYLVSNTYLDVYYNNVLNNYSSSAGAAVYVDNSSNSTSNNFKNNNFINKGGGYAWDINTGYISTSNYNNLYTSGSKIGYNAGSTYSSFSSWKSGTGYDANSKNADPTFTSTTDLHTSATAINNVATPIAGINDDIDGQSRDPFKPDIGADEFGTHSCLSGTYTIGGTSPDYSTFKLAVSALKSKGVCGPVIFNIRDGSYNEVVRIGYISGAKSVNTITFQSESGDSSKVILYSSTTTGSYVLDLDSASWITVSKLTIRRSYSGTVLSTYNVVQLHDGASNNSFRNNQVIGIYNATAGRIFYTPAGAIPDSFNYFYNNLVKYGSEGFHNESSKFNRYIGNTIDSAYTRGVHAYYQAGPFIGYNTITNLGVGSGDAILLDNCSSTYYGYVYNNKIAVSDNNGINLTGSTTDFSPAFVYNNFISIGGSTAVYGIVSLASSYNNIYYNNINDTNTSSSSHAMYAVAGINGNFYVINNNLINTGAGEGLYATNTTNITAFSNNNIYSGGTNIAYWGGSTYSSISSLQSGSSMNANSVSANPVYTSFSDLHVKSSTINKAGTPINGIATDIDGDVRDTSSPDIGADEFTPISAAVDAGISTISSPSASICPGAASFAVNLKNFGSDTLTSANINWTLNGIPQTALSWSGSLSSLSTASVSLGSKLLSSGSYKIKAWSTYPNGTTDGNSANDTSSISINVNNLPSASTGGTQSICSGTSAAIGASATSGHTYSWTAKPGSYISSSANPSVSPTLTTTYYLTESVIATGCSNSDSAVINVKTSPSAPTATSNSPVCTGDSLKLGSSTVSGATYEWTGPNSFTSTSQNPGIANAKSVNAGTYSLKITVSGCTSSAGTVSTTVNTRPSPSITGNKSVCENSTITYSTASASGHTYNWTVSGGTITSGGSTNSVSISWGSTGSGIIKVVEANSSGCKDSSSASVTINSAPTPSVSGSATVCAASSSSYSTTNNSGSSYAWSISGGSISSGAGTNSISVKWTSASGTASAKVIETNSAGCNDSSTLSITLNPLPAAKTGNDTAICSGNSLTIGSTAATGNTYSWISFPSGFTSSSAGFTVTPTVTTIYKLTETITSTGCGKTDSIQISVNPLPLAGVANDTSVCSGTILTLGKAAVSGNTYSWTSKPSGFTNTNSNPSTGPLATTVYFLKESVTITGCSNTDSLKVTVNPLPAANVGSSQSICVGSSASIGGTTSTGSSYTWYSKPSGFSSSLSSPGISPLVNTTYYLTETITASGCKKSDSVNITVNPLPVVFIGKPQTICSGQSAFIGDSSVKGMIYSWASKPAGFISKISSDTVTPAFTTVYYLIDSIAATGCSSNDSIIITVNPAPKAAIGYDATCLGQNTLFYDSSTLSSGNINSWSWDFGDGITNSNQYPKHTYASVGSYAVKLRVSSTSGCIDSASSSITIYPAIIPNFNWVANNRSVQFTPQDSLASSYLWDFGDGNSSNNGKPLYTYSADGKYKVTLIISNGKGCSMQSSDSVNVLFTGIAVQNVFIPELNIYPDPFKDKLMLDYQLENKAHVKISLFDISGRLISTLIDNTQDAGRHELQYNPADALSQGIYIMKISLDGRVMTRRLLRLK